MRLAYPVLVAALSISFGAVVFAADEKLDLPLRKAGLWDVNTQTDEGHGKRDQKLTMCIGEEAERNTVRTSSAENRANCPKYVVSKSSAGTIVDALCFYDDRKVTTHTELSGDFTTEFQVKVESSVSGNAPRTQGGAPVDVKRTILQSGKYLGESCGELSAGEAKTANGVKVVVQ